jgi:ATP-dependent helicase HrpA
VGETGSGTSTQLPKICLGLGRGSRGLIGHTQPRRIAARSIAARISSELGVKPGGAVGYKVRFSDRVSRGTYIKVMTDGILLAELESDRKLARYDTLIIDEAHERSINIDFLLGYLKRLLKHRHDLKLIITSATIDPSSFSRFFSGAPVVEAPGKSFPVEMRYRTDSEREDETESITEDVVGAVRKLDADKPGDVLVFLPGEKEIRATAKQLDRLQLPRTECVPLYQGNRGGCQTATDGIDLQRIRVSNPVTIPEASPALPGGGPGTHWTVAKRSRQGRAVRAVDRALRAKACELRRRPGGG